MRHAIVFYALSHLFIACGSEPKEGQPEDAKSISDALATHDTSDASVSDTHISPDSLDTTPAATETHSGSDLTDDSVADARSQVDATTEPGVSPWGTITGDCGAIGDAISEQSPAILLTTYTFDDPNTFDSGVLEGQRKKRFEEPNAGGSSKCTEVMSMQLLVNCEGAVITKLETEITYVNEGKIADYLADIDGIKTGVSVTRAYKGPVVDTYTEDDALALLEKKLDGIEQARLNASEADRWDQSLLHVWTLHSDWADTVIQTYEKMDLGSTYPAVVLVTVEEGSTYIVSDTCTD